MLQGIVLSATASVLFAVLYYYAVLLQPLDGLPIFGWRVALGLPVLTVWVLLLGSGAALLALWQRVRREPLLGLGLLVSAHLIGAQMALFTWAPLHGRALEVSLGYFLLPLVMVLAGRVVYGERLNRWQQLAVLLAALGVGHAIWQGDSLSWAAALVALGYPPYFMLRRRLQVEALPSLWAETLLLVPAAVWLLAGEPVSAQLAQQQRLWGLLPLLGVLSATALACYLAASRRLPLGLFGLLGYLEPALLFGVSLLLGERMAPGAAWTYVPIWLALGVLALDGLQQWRTLGKRPV